MNKTEPENNLDAWIDLGIQGLQELARKRSEQIGSRTRPDILGQTELEQPCFIDEISAGTPLPHSCCVRPWSWSADELRMALIGELVPERK